MVRKENYFRVLAILLPFLAIGTVVAVLYYEYVVVFEGSIKSVALTVYSDPACTMEIPQNTPYPLLGDLQEGWNNGTIIYVKNTGWYDNVTVGIIKECHTSNETAVTVDVFFEYPNGTTVDMGNVVQVVLNVEVTPAVPGEMPDGVTYSVTLRVGGTWEE